MSLASRESIVVALSLSEIVSKSVVVRSIAVWGVS